MPRVRPTRERVRQTPAYNLIYRLGDNRVAVLRFVTALRVPYARARGATFAHWYNDEHHHSALRFVTPAQRHRGEDSDLLARRHTLYQSARAKHPSAGRAQRATGSPPPSPQPWETAPREGPKRHSCHMTKRQLIS